MDVVGPMAALTDSRPCSSLRRVIHSAPSTLNPLLRSRLLGSRFGHEAHNGGSVKDSRIHICDQRGPALRTIYLEVF